MSMTLASPQEKILKIAAVALYLAAILYSVFLWRPPELRLELESGHDTLIALAVVLLIEIAVAAYAQCMAPKRAWHIWYVAVSVLTMTLVASGFLTEPGKWNILTNDGLEQVILVLAEIPVPLLLLISAFSRSAWWRLGVALLTPIAVPAAVIIWIIPST